MNRGSAQNGSSDVRRDSRFNEAPIHESGKWTCGSSKRSRRQCFNEAPIHESGKCWT